MSGQTIGRITGFLVVVMLVTAGVASAQEHPQAPAGDRHQSGMMMQGMPMPGPAMMLQHREQLGLSAAQVQRLEALAAGQRQTMQRLMPEAMRAMADLSEAASGEIDVNAARAAHDRMARIHSEMLVANLQALKEARQVLTPEQRTRWDAMAPQMGGVMRMMGPMMAPHPGGGRRLQSPGHQRPDRQH